MTFYLSWYFYSNFFCLFKDTCTFTSFKEFNFQIEKLFKKMQHGYNRNNLKWHFDIFSMNQTGIFSIDVLQKSHFSGKIAIVYEFTKVTKNYQEFFQQLGKHKQNLNSA